MRSKILALFIFLASLMTAAAAFAQEGHPLKGSWIGDWGPNSNDRNPITIIMDWDGKQITGMVNPGPGATQLQKATLDPKGWLVHFEVDTKNAAGQPVHYTVDGKIENLGLYNRSIVGTWNHDNVKGDFKITRQ
jgi:hypothetical protein